MPLSMSFPSSLKSVLLADCVDLPLDRLLCVCRRVAEHLQVCIKKELLGLSSLPRRKHVLSETLGFGPGGPTNCLFRCRVLSVQEHRLCSWIVS